MSDIVSLDNEAWIAELAILIKKAYMENKLLRSRYQSLVFTPLGLYAEIMKGQFRWGVVNWELIERPAAIDYPDPLNCEDFQKVLHD